MLRRLAVSIIAALAALTLAAADAGAANRFTIDPGANLSGSNVIVDAAGTAYIAWVHGGGAGPDTPRFCKVARGATCASPLALAIPSATGIADGVSGAFAVFGPAGTVYVVAPRFVRNDVVQYTSIDGGVTFDAGTIITSVGPASAYSNKTNPTNVIRTAGGDFYVGAYNAGLGFSTFPSAQGQFSFTDPGPGGVATSSLGVDSSGFPVTAFWNISSPPYPLLFYRYDGSGPVAHESNWIGPTQITTGYEPHLAGGASGLFLVSQDYASTSTPTAVNVRKYDGTTFGAPLTIAPDTTTPNLFAGGQIAQSPNGRIAVAWPGQRTGDNLFVMRLYVSTNGGASFDGPTNIATIGSGYGIQDNAQLATADDGGGWLTYRDSDGLQVADLTPIAAVAPPPPPPPVLPPPPPAAVVTPPALTKNTTVTVPGASITFTVPNTCVKPGSKFKVRLTWKRKTRKGNLFVKVRRADFYIAIKRVKIDVKAPFTQTLTVTAGSKSGSTIKLRARAFIKVKRGKSPTKSIRATIKVC